jgi:hypothetical protein
LGSIHVQLGEDLSATMWNLDLQHDFHYISILCEHSWATIENTGSLERALEAVEVVVKGISNCREVILKSMYTR